MHHDRFDALIRSLEDSNTRRGLLRLVAALPILGGTVALVPEASEAKDRRRRSKDHHNDKHKKRSGRRDKERKKSDKQREREREQNQRQREQSQQCVPEADAVTCAGKCATVSDNCGNPVNCGPCSCTPACPICQTCDAGTGQCVHLGNGTACGAGFECVNGACACTTTSCGAGCCAGATCVPLASQTDARCGAGGSACQNCASLSQLCGGGGTPGVCGCETTAETCAGQCGLVQNNCGQDVTCTPCPPSITSFAATPDAIDLAASPPETSATLAWATSNATDCSIDNGVGAVNCNDSTGVSPTSTTTYTLSASGAGGGPVTTQATVTVQYCHSIEFPDGACPTGATEFCRSQPINATSSDDALAACVACFGSGCDNHGTCDSDLGGQSGPYAWRGTSGGSDDRAFWYHSPSVGQIQVPNATCGGSGVRWAP